MISYIKGALGAVEDDVIVVETGGIGLAVHVPLSLLEELPPLGEEVTVYTYFQVREDAMTLYGFLHRLSITKCLIIQSDNISQPKRKRR